jgi:hypothetical protein
MSEFSRRKVTSALSYLGESPAPMVMKFSQPPACRGTFLVAEHSWVHWGLLPEGTAASPMLMSSIGWTRSSLGVDDAEAANFFPVEPSGWGSREAFFAAARSWDTSYFFLARSPECSSRSSLAGNMVAASR